MAPAPPFSTAVNTEKYKASVTQITARPRLWKVAAKNVDMAYALIGTNAALQEEAVKSIDATYDELTMDDALAKAEKPLAQLREENKKRSASSSAGEQPPFEAQAAPSRTSDRSNIDLMALRRVAEGLQQNAPSAEAAEVLTDFLSLMRSREWVGKSGKKMFGPVVRITTTKVTIETLKGNEDVLREHLNPRTAKVADRIMDLGHQVQMLESNSAATPAAKK